MRTSELHNELVDSVLSAGAVRPETLFPPGYEGDNADAVFVNERALVEVKSVCEDHAAAVALEARLAPTFQRWAKETESVIFGTVSLKWEDYPKWMQHEIDDLMAPSVARQLRKANRQFRETKRALNWEAGYGIAAFIVPNGFNVDPWVIGRIAWNQLFRRQGHFPHIDAVLVVTVPVEDQVSVPRPSIFAPLTRRDEPVPHKLSSRIRDAWFHHLSRKIGMPVYAFDATHEEFMSAERPTVKLRFDV